MQIVTEKSKLTFIVPFYNAEKYIKGFVKNLSSQTERNFQCIFIDDGSTDNSFNICSSLISNNPNFSVLHNEKNIGVGFSRVKGLKSATTDFVTFADIDDELTLNAAELILKNIKQKNADLYIYDYFEKSNTNKICKISSKNEIVSDLFLTKSKLISHLWNKVFSKKLLMQIDINFIEKITFAEDLWLCLQCFFYAEKINIIHETYYYYLYNAESLVRIRSEQSIMDNIAVCKQLINDEKFKSNINMRRFIAEDSFHAFGMLIFPKKGNQFQLRPHFDLWRKIESEVSITTPPKMSLFLKVYLKLIRQKKDFFAQLLWKILFLKEFIKNYHITLQTDKI